MSHEQSVIVETSRCWDCFLPSTSWQIGLYFSYLHGRCIDKFFPPVYSVMDDFGNLVPVQG